MCSTTTSRVRTDADPIQIDEARFTNRQKYNRGRLLEGDKALNTENETADVQNRRNHGRRIDGPWVFGLLFGLLQINDCRYFIEEQGDQDILTPLIKSECESNSVIYFEPLQQKVINMKQSITSRITWTRILVLIRRQLSIYGLMRKYRSSR